MTVDAAPGLSPGPFTNLDATLAPGEGHLATPALRVGRASYEAQLRADQADGPGQFAMLPIPTPRSIARQAVRRAAHGPLFLVHGGDFSFAELLGRPEATAGPAADARAELAANSDAAAFARALPDEYQAVESRIRPGLLGYGTLSVHMLTPADRE